MRSFQIVLEVLWVILAIFCLVLGIVRWSVAGHLSLIFFLLAALAAAMAFFRHSARIRSERKKRQH